jgi:chromosome segregation protein
MRLKRIRLSGFKSFAKPTTLEFPYGISAIVGPNGSGKSNIAEAIAWVLGEQSLKSLRGKRGEDLIFNGSLNLLKTSKALVTLVFETDERADEITISRAVYRDGTNEYFINDAKSRLKDNIEFLSKLGIGSAKHHIIAQGEADKILSVSLKERREMIEDALGLRIYALKRTESERKLLATKENIDRVRSLRREIQPHLRFLRKQVEKAEKILELKKRLGVLYSSYFSKALFLFEKEQGHLDGQLKRNREQRAEVGRKIETLKKKLGRVAKTTDGIKKIRNEISDLERQIGRCEGIISQLKKTPYDWQRKINETKKINECLNYNIIRELIERLDQKIEQALAQKEISLVRKILQEMKKIIFSFSGSLKDKGKSSVNRENNAEKLFKQAEKRRELLKEALIKAKQTEEGLVREKERVFALEGKIYQWENEMARLQKEEKSLSDQKRVLNQRKEFLEQEKMEAKEILPEAFSDLSNRSYLGERQTLSWEDVELNRREIERLKIRLEESRGISQDILSEYEETKSRDEFLASEIEDLEKTSHSLEKLIEQLDEKLIFEFERGVKKINQEFQKFFELIFGGGRAELKLVSEWRRRPTRDRKEKDELEGNDVSEEDMISGEDGLEIKVNLPRKKIRSLDMLSGGERALTSIALLFAISRVKPPPFLVLDETDAALDEANSRKFARMLKDLSRNTQLILITHNRETMRGAEVLYGVTMAVDGVSRLLSIRLEEAEAYVDGKNK